MGHIKLVEWLLNQGANPSMCGENYTAFFVAAGGGFKDVAKLLFEQGGVDVDDVDIYGLTALDWAYEKWASVPTGCLEFEAIKATIEWLLYKRASPCACAASLRPHMAFQLCPAAASGSSEAPVPASSAAPAGIRSSEPALALALALYLYDHASTFNRRIYMREPFPFSAPRALDEDSDGSSVDYLAKFHNLRIIMPGEGGEEDSPSVDYGEEEEQEEEEEEDEEGLGSFEGRSFFSLSTGDPAVSFLDEIVAVGEASDSDYDYDPEYLHDQASTLNRRIYMREPFPFSAPRALDEDSDGSSVDSFLDEIVAVGEASDGDYAQEDEDLVKEEEELQDDGKKK